MIKRVLVVDDDPTIREVFRRMLELKGIKVTTAADGDEGTFRAISEKPDVILMDVEMPGIDGISVTRWLRRSEFAASVPVVMLSGCGTRESVRAAREAGCSDFIVKGEVSIGTLIQRLGRAAARPAPPVFQEETGHE